MAFIFNKTKATIDGGRLSRVSDCYLVIPAPSGPAQVIDLYILPELSDTKSARYNDEPVIGRAFPVKTYAESENRSISLKMHFVTWVSDGGDLDPGTPAYNLRCLNLIRSATYPIDSTAAPYEPPPICRLRCGQLLTKNREVCVVLKQYSVSFPTDCAWDEATKCPYKFDVDTNWDVVYRSSSLPGQARIIQDGGDAI